MGYTTTLEYVAAAAGAVLRETGLLPHINAGVMSAADMHALRAVSVSQGLMLESLSSELLLPGGAHNDCPDKVPEARLAALEAAGQARVPFTTGILIGIGETRRDRVHALLAIKASHERHGHIQEVIIQNFKAKSGTGMAGVPEPSLTDLLWTVAVARLILGPEMNIQAPPNLTPDSDDVNLSNDGTATDPAASWKALLDAGINDWGGISPITRDFVNPERPWPHALALAEATAQAGKALVPRLPIYPSYLTGGASAAGVWVDGSAGRDSPLAAVLRSADVHGLARACSWYAGAADGGDTELAGGAGVPAFGTRDDATRSMHGSSRGAGAVGKHRATPAPRRRLWAVAVGTNGLLEGAPSPPGSTPVTALLDAVMSKRGHELTEEEIELLFEARGADFEAVIRAADELRRRVNGDTVTYVVNRNINYTNVCTFGCQFCAFSKG